MGVLIHKVLEDSEQLVPAARKRGRPAKEINLAAVQALAQLGCGNKEIAAALGVSLRTIESRRRDPDFQEAMERGEANGNIALRRKQFNLAMAGDRTMLIWLGKQRLGQKDKILNEHEGAMGAPPPKIHVQFVSPKKVEAPEATAEPQAD